MTISQVFLVLMTLTALRCIGQVFCRMPLSWNLFFLVARLMLRVWEEEHRQLSILIPSYQGFILSIWFITVDVDLTYLPEVVFVRFLYCGITLFSFFPFCTPFCILWNRITNQSPHLRIGELCSPSLGCAIHINCHSSQEICLFSSVYSFIQSFIHSSVTHGYLFYNWVIIPYSLHFIAQIVPASISGCFFS